jgi:hypothetical protein
MMRTIILAIACLVAIGGSAHANGHITCDSSGRITQTHGYLNMGATLPPRIEELEAKPPRIVVRKKITVIKVKPWNHCAERPPAPPDRRRVIG